MSQEPALFYAPGDVIDYTPASADVAAGQVVEIGTIPMIAPVAIKQNTKGALAKGGIWRCPHDAVGKTAGDAIYWNATGTPIKGGAGTGAATKTHGSNNLMGIVAEDAADDDDYCKVLLTAAKRTTTIGGAVTASSIAAEDSSLGVTGLQAAQGGAIPVTGGTSTTAANAGGPVSLTGGTGGATGNGGAASVVGGTPGATSGTGGAASLTGGGSAAGVNYTGGAASVTGGAGKGNLAGGAASVTGGTCVGSGAGGAVAVTGGQGGTTAGNGGAITVTGGAGQADNGNGGAVTVRGGAKHGSGNDGALALGDDNTASVTIGKASVATKIVGPDERGLGASTAADGSSEADAEGLPAGTASVYPTTAADDTKGVKLNAADKVLGRMVIITNGVHNKILKVYPPAGGNIAGAGADVAISTASGRGLILVCTNAGGAGAWQIV